LHISFWVIEINFAVENRFVLALLSIDFGVSAVGAVMLLSGIGKDVQPLVPFGALFLAFVLSLVHPANMNVLLLFNGSIPHHVLQTVSPQRLQKLPFFLAVFPLRCC